MTKKDDSLIVAILDRSGSMGGREDDVIGGYNKLMEDQASQPGTGEVSLFVFDHELITVYEYAPLDRVPTLAHSTYNVRGSTALLDAVGTVIDRVGRNLAARNERDRPEHVIVVIFTDGYENASKMSYSKPGEVAQMIQHQEDKYGWTFMYLGADQDAWNAANQTLGFRNMAHTFNYANNSIGTQNAYFAASTGISSARVGSAVDLNSTPSVNS